MKHKKPLWTLLLILTAVLVVTAPYLHRRHAIQEFLYSFYDVLYEGYVRCEYLDLSPFMEDSSPDNQNFMIRQKNLFLYRKCAQELGEYVETQKSDYEIHILDITSYSDMLRVRFKLTGERLTAYPPFFCMEQTTYYANLKEIGGGYVIQRISNEFTDLVGDRCYTNPFVLTETLRTVEETRARVREGYGYPPL